MTNLALGSARTATFAYNGTLPTLSTVTQNGTPQSVTYDPAGNQGTVGPSLYLYSPRGLLAQGDGLSYLYDGRGARTVSVLGGQAYGSVAGTVVDAATNAPLPTANVTISGTSFSTSTDASGNFTLLGPAGTSR